MAVPLLDLTRQYSILQDEIEAAALGVLRSGRYVLGPEVEAFEREVGDYLGAAEVVGMSSGTDALLAALMAVGVGPGDRVAVPVYSFFATAGVVSRLGARPVFVDIEPQFCNLDPARLRDALARDPGIKAVVFVHLYGAGEGVHEIAAVAAEHGIPMIEDAAQAIGTRSGGAAAGRVGLIGCFSTFPSKNLGGTGDGGFCTTDDAEVGQRLRFSRNHGQTESYRHAFVGGNFRLDALQAACLRVKLRHLERFTEQRRAHAARYAALFAQAGLDQQICPPRDVADRHAYHQYVVHLRAEARDAVRAHLQARQVGCSVYYPLPFHLQPCFADLGHQAGEFPVAERAAATNLALPVFPELIEAEQDEVVETLGAALGVRAG